MDRDALEKVEAVASVLADWLSVERDVTKLILKAQKHFREIDSSLIRLAVDVAAGREVAKKEYPELSKGFFTKTALQQRTHPRLAEFHSSFFNGSKNTLELCTGLGFDTHALCRVSEKVVSIERDEITAAWAKKNLELLKDANAVVKTISLEEFVAHENLSHFDGIFADPSRRNKKGARVKDADDYEPSLKDILSLPTEARFVIKISPAINIDVQDEWKKVWVGFQGECKEQLLVKNTSIQNDAVYVEEATLLWSPEENAPQNDQIAIHQEIPSGEFELVEPHPALSRSGLLPGFYEEHDVFQWDPDIIYGVSPAEGWRHPFCTFFKIFFVDSFNEKKLQHVCEELHWDNRTEIKKRGIEEEPETVRKKIKLPSYGNQQTDCGVIFLTKAGKKKIMMLGQRLDKNQDGAY